MPAPRRACSMRGSLLQGIVAVITGASSGNGRAIAHAFAREGASVVLAARRKAALDQAATECGRFGGQALAVQTDVADPAAVEELGRRAIEHFGRFDIWVNNAGVLHLGRFDETPTRVLHRVVETTLFGCMHGSQTALRHFRQRRRGTLINMSSLLGIVGQPYAGAYVASKFGIRGLSEALRQEVLDEPDIHVCTLLPAAIDTPIYQRAANYTRRSVHPITPCYDVKLVADTVLSLARHPRREAFVGWIGPLATLHKSLAPGLTERMVKSLIERMELGPDPAPPTEGNLFQPVYDRWKVRGGWREARESRSSGQAIAGLTLAALSLGLLLSTRRVR
jgi:NAD(P)-dependent dehydrogenase (short-subunit alcohol dehydrogenase family)